MTLLYFHVQKGKDFQLASPASFHISTHYSLWSKTNKN